jgi:hypothetical protein
MVIVPIAERKLEQAELDLATVKERKKGYSRCFMLSVLFERKKNDGKLRL